jgi:hypothetical protein
VRHRGIREAKTLKTGLRGGYTDAEVARMSVGVLTEGEVEGMKTGKMADPTVGQVAALAAVFGVAPSYLVDRKGTPSLDSELLDALADETAAAILRASVRLPEREKRVVLGIVREFGETTWARGGSVCSAVVVRGIR